PALPPRGAPRHRFGPGGTVALPRDRPAAPAEVFAAALHDRAEATTVGEPTVGMAILQRLVPTESGGSLFMTVARYVSPNGTMLGGKGLQPDDRVLATQGGDPEAEGRESRDAIREGGLELVRNPRATRRVACRLPRPADRAVVVV